MKRLWLLPFGIIFPLVAASGIPSHPPERFSGIWSNPKGTVHVRTQSCGVYMCGIVVWASKQAQADAAKGSGRPLVGSTLFRNFQQDKHNSWRGTVYVPDINKTFSGTIRLKDSKHLEGKGCLIGHSLCKSQIWERIR